MTTDNQYNVTEQEGKDNIAVPPARRRHRNLEKKDTLLHIRQWLNIIFMLGAVVGMAIYFFGNQTIGTVIILVSMVFKIAECTLRFIHK